MEEKMKKISHEMSIRMAIIMSFFLSMTGTLISGNFSIPRIIVNFLISTVISLLIGFLIPMGRLTVSLCAALKLRRGSLAEKLLTAFITDLFYTPVMTAIMVYIGYKVAMIQSGGMAQLNYFEMLIPSLIICLCLGFAIIIVFQPPFMKQLLKKYDVQ
jgi:hypothetical protein